MIKAIIFDWGGVLAEADTESAANYLAEKYQCNALEIKKIIQQYEPLCSESNDYQLFLEKINQKFKIPFEEIKKAMLLLPEMRNKEIIKRLQDKYILCILSNQMKFKTDFIRETNDLSCFDFLFFSSEIGCQKPSSKAFLFVVDRINISAQECLFIDDNPINVAAAKEIGMQGLLCINPNQLEIILRKYKKDF